MRAVVARSSHLPGCAWFWTWALGGAALALAFLSLGILLLVPAVGATVLLGRRHATGSFGLLTGIGAVLLAIAYIQRSGQSYDPIHWLLAGLVFFAAGLAGHAWRNVRRAA